MANLVKKYATANPHYLANDLKISVRVLDLPIPVRGFYACILKQKFIALNSNLSEVERKVVLCHELGHAQLHTGFGYYYTLSRKSFISSRRENEANEFAMQLLSYSHDLDPDLWANVLNDHHQNPDLIHKILSDLITN